MAHITGNTPGFLLLIVSSLLIGSLAEGLMPQGSASAMTYIVFAAIAMRSTLASTSRETKFAQQARQQHEYAQWTTLHAAIDTLAQWLNMPQTPSLSIRPVRYWTGALAILTLGTPKRACLVLSPDKARALQDQLLATPQAAETATLQLLQSLEQCRSGEHWRMTYLRSLVELMFWFTLWYIPYLIGMTWMTALTIPEIQALAQNPEQIEQIDKALGAYLPQMATLLSDSANQVVLLKQKWGSLDWIWLLQAMEILTMLPLIAVTLVLAGVHLIQSKARIRFNDRVLHQKWLVDAQFNLEQFHSELMASTAKLGTQESTHVMA